MKIEAVNKAIHAKNWENYYVTLSICVVELTAI